MQTKNNKYINELNSSIMNGKKIDSTSFFMNISIIDKVQTDNTFPIEKNNASTLEVMNKIRSLEERTRFIDEVKEKNQQQEDLANIIEKNLLSSLMNYSLENETLSEAEKMISEIARKYSFSFLGEIITKIYVNNYDLQNVISGICAGLERFDSSEVFPWGQSIVIGLINHKSTIVKERVISLIDNWNDSSLLPALKSMNVSSLWMRNYINEVILSLGDNKCIM